jgi:hypothetical protein
MSMMVNWVLNGPGAVEVELNPRNVNMTAANLRPGSHQLSVYRNGTKVWSGYIWTIRASFNNDSGQHTLALAAEGFFSKLRYRLVTQDKIYTSVNLHQIAWNLIAYTQGKTNGDLGLTQGSHVGGSVSRDRDYCYSDFQNIGDAIDELSSMDDGIDWAVTPTITIATNKVFRTWNPRRGSDLTGTVTLDQTKMSQLDYTRDATELVNLSYNLGQDDCNPPELDIADSGSQSTYGLFEAQYDLESRSRPDLRSHGNEIIRNYKAPTLAMEARYVSTKGPAFGAFDIGDIITVSSNVTAYTIAAAGMRVMSIQIDLAETTEFWTVGLDSVIV